MVLGGVETELITVLKRFDKSKYDITLLLLYEQDNEILKRIPEGIKIVNLDISKQYYCSGLSTLVKERIKRGEIIPAIKLCFKRMFGISPTGANVDIDTIPSIEEEYDYAVCYHMHSPVMLRYVADKVKAKRKIIWIHNEFNRARYKIEKYDKWLFKYYRVVAVSKQLRDEFVSKLPSLEEYVTVAHNIVDEQLIFEKSKDLSHLDTRFKNNTSFKLLTIGRFVEQKGYDIAVETARILRDKGLDFTWYIIGYGVEEDNIRMLVNRYSLEDKFIILGKKDNPYPYTLLCDLYVQTSRHEGFSITLTEALVLGKTIVCTRFAGSEQIQTSDDGTVVNTFEPVDIANEIERYILAPELLKKSVENGVNSQNGWNKIEALFTEE